MIRTLFTIITALVLTLPAMAESTGDAKAVHGRAAARSDAEERLYEKATHAIDEQRWSDAVDALQKIIEQGSSRLDRALYWKAYAQSKSGRQSDALETLATLRSRYPSSSWIDDAKALEVEIRQSSGEKVAPERMADDDLKLIAITSLMNADPERATTVLEKMLRAPGSSDSKERALFVLAQLKSDHAQQVLEEAARGTYGRELQEDAIRSIGTTGGAKRRPFLVDIYEKSKDVDVKTAILQSFLVSGDRDRLLQAASTDPNPELRSEAARLLGAMHATTELDRLYASEKSEEVKEDIIQGMFVAGDVTRLASLAREEPNPELRRAAIRGLGVLGSKRTGDLLLQLWGSATDIETKDAIAEGLFVQGNAPALITLARRETNREVKRTLVQKLSVMHSKEAREYMMELLKD